MRSSVRKSHIFLFLNLFAIAIHGQVTSHMETTKRFPGMAGTFNTSETKADGTSRFEVLVTRIIDTQTRLPVPGATMSLVAEESFPLSGGVYEPLRTATADAWGWVRMDMKGISTRDWGWIFYDAPGYAPQATFGNYAEFPQELHKGRDAVIRVTNRLGHPLSGVGLGLILGCGHTPDIRFSTSNSDGLVTLRNVGPRDGIADIWPLSSRTWARYLDWNDAFGPFQVGSYELPWAPGVHGLVVDESGLPIVGAHVGLSQCHRGPWTVTNKLGEFELPGIDARETLFHAIQPDAKEMFPSRGSNLFPRPIKGFPCRLVLKKDGTLDLPERNTILRVRPLLDFVAIPQCEVALVRFVDGYTLWGKTGAKGEAEFKISPTDKWAVIVNDSRLVWQPKQKIISNQAIARGEIAVNLEKNPVVHVLLDVASGEFPQEIALVTQEEEVPLLGQLQSVDLVLREDELARRDFFVAKIPVPKRGEVAIRIVWPGAGGDIYSEVGYVQRFKINSRREPIVISQPQAVVCRIDRFLGKDGMAVRAATWILDRRDPLDDDFAPMLSDPEFSFGNVSIPLSPGRARWLLIQPENRLLSSHWIRLDTISVGDPPLELATIQLDPIMPAKIKVLLPGGKPARGQSIDCRGRRIATCDEGGNWQPRFLSARDLRGLSLRFESYDDDRPQHQLVPFEKGLEGIGPWILSWPTGVVDLQLTLAKNTKSGSAPSEIDCYLDGNKIVFRFEWQGRVLSLRLEGVKSGAHRLIVSSDGFWAHEIEFDLQATELSIPIELHSGK